MEPVTANEARQTSEKNRAAAEVKRKREARKKKLWEAECEAEYAKRHAEYLRKEYEERIAKGIKAGSKSVSIVISTIHKEKLTVKEFLQGEDDAKVLRSIYLAKPSCSWLRGENCGHE